MGLPNDEHHIIVERFQESSLPHVYPHDIVLIVWDFHPRKIYSWDKSNKKNWITKKVKKKKNK
jgi:hypothetical protein